MSLREHVTSSHGRFGGFPFRSEPSTIAENHSIVNLVGNTFSHILGHKRQISAIERLIAQGVKSGVFFFCGPEHIGKAQVAKSFAAATLGVPVDELERHPDYLFLSPELKENGTRAYDIDSIRDALHRLGQSSVLGTTVAMIDDANTLNVASQNALLKALEEPNPSTLILLVCHDETTLLPTVRSRGVVWSFFGPIPQGSDEVEQDARRLTDSSLVTRLQAAQDIAKRETRDIEPLLIALVDALHHSGKATAKTLHAVLKTREQFAANANSTVALTELAVQLGQYE